MSLALVPAASAAVPNACTLVPTAQVQSAPDGKIKGRSGYTNRGGSVCIWTSSTNVRLNLQLLAMPKAEFKKGMSDEPEAQAFQGIGELAYVLGGGRVVTAWHRGIALTVAYSTLPPSQAAKRFAKAAVARL
jgi:hypothetical protein